MDYEPKREDDEAAYATLLNTVESLQADLQQTVTTCHGLREANAQLRRNFDAAKDELLRQREKVAANRAELIRASKAKLEGDRQTEVLVAKWKAQLDERTKELEGLQAKLVPQDLDMLRIQVQEELELPHQQKVADLEAEARSFQQMFFNVRRELERARTEFEQYAAHADARALTDKAAADAEAAGLRARVNELESAAADGPDGEDLVRKLEAQVLGLEVKCRELGRENDGLRREHDAAVADAAAAVRGRAEDAVAAKALTGQLKTDAVGLGAQLAEATNRCSRLEQDLEGKQRDLDAARELSTAEANAAAARARAQAAGIQDAEAAAADFRRDAEAARAELARDADAFGRKLDAAETECATARRAAFEARIQCDATVAAARAECRELCASLEERLVAQDLDKSSAEKKARADDAQRLDDERKLAAEVKVLSATVARLEADVEKVHKPQKAALEDEKARLALDRDAHKRRADALEAAENAALKAVDDKERALLDVTKAEKRCADALETVERLRREADGLRDRHAREVGDLRASVASDKVHVANAIRAETDAIRKQADEALRRERRRSAAYKEKCLAAHDREKRSLQTLKMTTRAQAEELVA